MERKNYQLWKVVGVTDEDKVSIWSHDFEVKGERVVDGYRWFFEGSGEWDVPERGEIKPINVQLLIWCPELDKECEAWIKELTEEHPLDEVVTKAVREAMSGENKS